MVLSVIEQVTLDGSRPPDTTGKLKLVESTAHRQGRHMANDSQGKVKVNPSFSPCPLRTLHVDLSVKPALRYNPEKQEPRL